MSRQEIDEGFGSRERTGKQERLSQRSSMCSAKTRSHALRLEAQQRATGGETCSRSLSTKPALQPGLQFKSWPLPCCTERSSPAAPLPASTKGQGAAFPPTAGQEGFLCQHFLGSSVQRYWFPHTSCHFASILECTTLKFPVICSKHQALNAPC